MKQQISVAGALINDNKILIVKRSQVESYLPGYWELPGGKVDFGEHPEKALIREFQEEVGLNIKPLKPIRVFDYTTNKETTQTIEIVYMCLLAGGMHNPQLSAAHDEYAWISEVNFTKYTLSNDIQKNITKAFAGTKT